MRLKLLYGFNRASRWKFNTWKRLSIAVISRKHDDRYKLEDILGIETKFAAKLRKAKILTVKDLLNCNVKMKSKEIEGIGEGRLNKWK